MKHVVSVGALVFASFISSQLRAQQAPGPDLLIPTSTGCNIAHGWPSWKPPYPDIQWTGGCIDGLLSGEGELQMSGMTFRGTFENGSIVKGELESEPLNYKGGFKNNLWDGQGTMRLSRWRMTVTGVFSEGHFTEAPYVVEFDLGDRYTGQLAYQEPK